MKLPAACPNCGNVFDSLIDLPRSGEISNNWQSCPAPGCGGMANVINITISDDKYSYEFAHGPTVDKEALEAAIDKVVNGLSIDELDDDEKNAFLKAYEYLEQWAGNHPVATATAAIILSKIIAGFG